MSSQAEQLQQTMSFFKLAGASAAASSEPLQRSVAHKPARPVKPRVPSRAGGGFSLTTGATLATANAPDEALFAKF
jgi:methyl-accepting chemotaxis protein